LISQPFPDRSTDGRTIELGGSGELSLVGVADRDLSRSLINIEAALARSGPAVVFGHLALL
jgi:hypothetical protein